MVLSVKTSDLRMGDRFYIDRLTADAVELLKGMIAIPSPSFEEETVCS